MRIFVIMWLLTPLIAQAGLLSPLGKVGKSLSNMGSKEGWDSSVVFRAAKRFHNANEYYKKKAQMANLSPAAHNKNVRLVKKLLSEGVNPDEIDPRDEFLRTPLMRALEIQRFGSSHKTTPVLVDMLLKKGADVNARDVNGVTPLMYAFATGRRERVKVLLEAGADPHAVDDGGNSVMVWAYLPTYYWGHSYEKTVKPLIEAGVDSNYDIKLIRSRVESLSRPYSGHYPTHFYSDLPNERYSLRHRFRNVYIK